MQHHRAYGHQVLPVFYDVDPKDVRNQSGSFAKAFAKHVLEQKMDKVEEWRRALGDVADMGGMVLGDQYESQFIQHIVHETLKMLNDSLFKGCSNIVGMPYRVQKLNRWLKDGSNDVDVAVICGIGGIGKTTVARVAYNLNFYRFQGSSFLEDIGGTLEEDDGVLDLQKKLLSDIQRGEETEAIDISSPNEGRSKIKHAVCCKRVLIVFDDVSHSNQFNEILGKRRWYCPGSKLIITTKDKHLLKNQEIPHAVFEVEKFDEHESLELFCLRAFGEAHPFEGFQEISRLAVQLSGGLPLALHVLAACLSRKSVDLWQKTLQKRNPAHDGGIQNIQVKISGGQWITKIFLIFSFCLLFSTILNKWKTALGPVWYYCCEKT
ncbi:disease resistance protein Roq1-like isoform X2 [Rosa rugosa]|nr:disease resistance protein Roq1-like isoform X2 [Rosa rugosa]XP_062003895.1 disease resistance protein Roq1-like isoform X2 [Rosa rugosa]